MIMGDMERKNTLIVFTLASVLVLAVFSANENAYAQTPIIDDLHCYELAQLPPFSPFQIRLVDQFENEIHDVLDLEEICNPVLKIPQNFPPSIPVTDQHWSSYLLDPTVSPQVIASVIIEDQYHPGGFQVDVTDEADFLMVPTAKEHNGIFPNLSDIHFKCYTLEQPQQPVFDITFLQDQFGSFQYQELLPVEICNPVEKFLQDPVTGQFDVGPFGDQNIPEHYLCYDITPPNLFPLLDFLSIDDQFTSTNIAQIELDGVLCTIAQKTVIPPPTVGGSDVAINTSALLLAGATSNSMWMIPVVIAGIGIGIFVIKRRN